MLIVRRSLWAAIALQQSIMAILFISAVDRGWMRYFSGPILDFAVLIFASVSFVIGNAVKPQEWRSLGLGWLCTTLLAPTASLVSRGMGEIPIVEIVYLFALSASVIYLMTAKGRGEAILDIKIASIFILPIPIAALLFAIILFTGKFSDGDLYAMKFTSTYGLAYMVSIYFAAWASRALMVSIRGRYRRVG
jgi:hypothetical protein